MILVLRMVNDRLLLLSFENDVVYQVNFEKKNELFHKRKDGKINFKNIHLYEFIFKLDTYFVYE